MTPTSRQSVAALGCASGNGFVAVGDVLPSRAGDHPGGAVQWPQRAAQREYVIFTSRRAPWIAASDMCALLSDVANDYTDGRGGRRPHHAGEEPRS